MNQEDHLLPDLSGSRITETSGREVKPWIKERGRPLCMAQGRTAGGRGQGERDSKFPVVSFVLILES